MGHRVTCYKKAKKCCQYLHYATYSDNGLSKDLLAIAMIAAQMTCTKKEVCNCKLIRINNQLLLDDGNRIIIPHGNCID